MNYWLYKWNARGRNHHLGLIRDFATIFNDPPITNTHRGTIAALYRQLKKGDLLICYQCAGGVAEGICIVTDKGEEDGRKWVYFTPAVKFPLRVPLQSLKRRNPDLQALPQLNPGPAHALLRFTGDQASIVINACVDYVLAGVLEDM